MRGRSSGGGIYTIFWMVVLFAIFMGFVSVFSKQLAATIWNYFSQTILLVTGSALAISFVVVLVIVISIGGGRRGR